MKKISAIILKIEEFLAGILLCVIAILIFWSATTRKLGVPVNWAQDISLLAFGWLTFIGADILIKKGVLIKIDIIFNRLPKLIQKILMIIFDLLILCFLVALIFYGTILVTQSWNRMFHTLKLSYAWCTLAVPVCSFLMLFSMIIQIKDDIKRPLKRWGKE